MQELVSKCSFGERYEDLAAAALRDASPESFLGLWPEFALMNHSCATNTVQVMLSSGEGVRKKLIRHTTCLGHP